MTRIRTVLSPLSALIFFAVSAFTPSDHPIQPSNVLQPYGNGFFIQNVGQFQGGEFLLKGEFADFWFSGGELRVSQSQMIDNAAGNPISRRETFFLSFAGSNPAVAIEPFGRLDTTLSYLIGSDPENWHVRVPVWSGLRIRNLYDGIDLLISGISPNGGLDWALESQPGADLSVVQLMSKGAQSVVSPDGALQLSGVLGTIRLTVPTESPVDSQAGVNGGELKTDSLSVDLSTASGSSLQATRTFNYLSFLGGSGQDKALSIAAENGIAYVTGSTTSADFPLTPGVVDTTLENTDAFVVKVNDAGTGLTYATFIGGNLDDVANDIAVENGIAYIAGRTNSTTFPGMSPWENRDFEAFAVSLTADGTGIRYAKRYGGTVDVEKDEANGIAVEAGNAYLTGLTYSRDLYSSDKSPTPTIAKGDIFVIKINPAGTTSFISIQGGGSLDAAYDIAVSGGVAYITGESDSKFFMGPFPAGYEAFVLKIDAVGGLAWTSVLSGSNSDRGNGITLDSSGNIYVVGATDSSNFITSLSPVLPYSALDDGFIVRLNSSGTPNFRTFLGGRDHDRAFAVAVDGMGGVQVTGETYSDNFPVTADAFGLALSGLSDAFVTRILPGDVSPLNFSSYLGGTSTEFGRGLALDIRGITYICGETSSTDLAVTPSSFDINMEGEVDGYVGKLPIGPIPSVVLKKYTNDSDAGLPPGPYILKNDPVSWKYNIYNTGGSDLSSIVLTDNLLGTITCPMSTLAPGASMECTATGTAITGQYENLGTVVAQPPGGLPSVTDDDLSHYFGADPNMTITATTAGLDGRLILVGQTAAITYLVKNTGNVPLGNVTVTDTAGIEVTCLKNTLNSGEEMTCNSSIVVTAGTTSHTANVTADPPSGLSSISASDPTSHFGAAPSIMLTNKVSVNGGTTWNDSNATPTAITLLTGYAPKFQLSVYNSGNVDLINISSGCSTIANLAVGETSTPCVVTDSWASGEQQNQKTATGSYTDGLNNVQPLSSSDSAYYFGASPALTIQKEISLNDGSTWLDTTTGDAPTLLSGTDPQYRITVKNTGNIALLTTIADPYLDFGTSCQPTTLQPQATQVCTASKAWATNLQTNTAHGTASFKDSGNHTTNLDVSDSAKYFGASPALTFEKYVSVNGGATWLEADDTTGQTLLSGYAAPQYKVVITNGGNVPITGISVSDGTLTLTGCAAPFDLAVSGSNNCTASAVWSVGPHENTASLTAAYTDSAGHTFPFALSDKAHYFGADPQLNVTKDVSVDGGTTWVPADSAPGPYLLVGQDQPRFKFTLTNSGNVSLSPTLSDSSITIPTECATGALAPLASRQCIVTGTWAAGSHVNTVQASAGYTDTPGNIKNVSVSNQAYYYGAQPQLVLKKYVSGDGGATWDDAESQPGPYFLSSADLRYKLVLDNTGNVTLSSLTWNDPAFSLSSCSLPSTLTPEAAAVECILTGTWAAGQVDNLATASGSFTDSGGYQASPSDTDAAYYFGAEPGVSIVKSTNGDDADTAPGPNILVGDTVTWTYTITNTGNMPLTGIAVSDDNGTPLNAADDFTASCSSTGLAAGADETCTASGIAIEGQYENLGTVSAQPTTGVVSIGLPLSVSDPSHYFGAQISLTLEKTTNAIVEDNTPPGPFIAVGSSVTWNYKVTNTSNISIGPIYVRDDNGTPANLTDDLLACTISNLAPGQSNNPITCMLSTTAIAGQYANTGRAEVRMLEKDYTAYDMGHYYGYVPGEVLNLSVEINNQNSPPPTGIYIDAGDTLIFKYRIYNSSPSAISSVTLTDTTDNVVICQDLNIEEFSSTVCERTINAQAGQHKHDALVTGYVATEMHSDSTSSSYFGATPGITLDVHTNGQDPASPSELPIKAGSAITWEYFVQNTSNIPLSGISVVQVPEVTATCLKTTLAVGESTTCSASGTAQAGAITNHVTVNGVWPDDLQAFYGYADSYYYGVVPGVTLDVTINGSPADSTPGPEIIEGQTVTYAVDLTNTGNYLLEDISIKIEGTSISACGTTVEAGAYLLCETTEVAVLGQQTRKFTVSGTVNGETINAEKTVYYTGKEDLYFVFLPLILR